MAHKQENVVMNFKIWERMGSRTGVTAEVDWRSQLTEEQAQQVEERLPEAREVGEAREAAVDWATHPYRDEKQAVDGLFQALSELPGLSWVEVEQSCVDGPESRPLLNVGGVIQVQQQGTTAERAEVEAKGVGHVSNTTIPQSAGGVNAARSRMRPPCVLVLRSLI